MDLARPLQYFSRAFKLARDGRSKMNLMKSIGVYSFVFAGGGGPPEKKQEIPTPPNSIFALFNKFVSFVFFC